MTTVSTQIAQLAANDNIPQTSSYASNGDVRIHYRTFGAGTPLLFQHGFPDMELTWFRQIEEFARDHLVIVPTLRGFPPSSCPVPVGDYAIAELVSDIVAVLDDLEIETADIAGHDWGGVVLQALALQQPERVKSLVMMNTPVLQPFLNLLQSDRTQQEMSVYTLAYHAYQDGDDKNIEYVVRNIRDVGWRAHIADYMDLSPIHGMLNYYKAGYPGPPYGAVPEEDQSAFVYRVPTLILWGLEDPYFSVAHLNNLWDWFEQSYRFVSIPGAGHWVHQDQPEKVNAELRSWLAHRKDNS
jgi:pimeloyl-ACP methyl ester carboxylesterase